MQLSFCVVERIFCAVLRNSSLKDERQQRRLHRKMNNTHKHRTKTSTAMSNMEQHPTKCKQGNPCNCDPTQRRSSTQRRRRCSEERTKAMICIPRTSVSTERRRENDRKPEWRGASQASFRHCRCRLHRRARRLSRQSRTNLRCWRRFQLTLQRDSEVSERTNGVAQTGSKAKRQETTRTSEDRKQETHCLGRIGRQQAFLTCLR